MRGIDWTLVDPLLGKDYDNAIAKKFCVSYTAIINRRQSFNISRYEDNSIEWSKIDPFLGTDTDQALALRFNCSGGAILDRRRRLDIPAYRSREKTPTRLEWHKITPYMGKMSDVAIAKMFHCRASTITRKRIHLKIRRYIAPKQDYSRILDKVVGTLSANKIHEKYGIPQKVIQKYKNETIGRI
jgi:hypothetical protein